MSSENPNPNVTPAPPAARPSNVELPPRVIVELPSRRWHRFTRWVAWTGFIFCVLLLISQSVALQSYFDTTDGIQEKYHSGSKTAQSKIAIINVTGIIMDGDGFVKNQIDRIKEDDSVRAVVVRIESPGGTVTGSDYIFHYLKKLREQKKIPVVVSMGSIAASGGYYIAMAVGDQEKSIYAEPTTTTGSIGVIVPHYDLSGLLERFDVKDDSVASHSRKQLLSITRPMSDDHRQLISQYVNESFERFKSIVREGRPAFREQDGIKFEETDLATGEIFSAERAKQFKLIDEIGFIEDAIDRAAELAKVDAKQVRVVEYERTANLIEGLIGYAKASDKRQQWMQLMEDSVPRPYYLAAPVPPMLLMMDRPDIETP